MNTNIQKYLAFLTAVEYESFTKAAQILNYSQSGISRMIHDLGRLFYYESGGAQFWNQYSPEADFEEYSL